MEEHRGTCSCGCKGFCLSSTRAQSESVPMGIPIDVRIGLQYLIVDDARVNQEKLRALLWSFLL